MPYRALVVALVAACSSPASSGLEVLPGPEIVVKEGETSEDHFLHFNGEPVDIDQVELDHPFADLVERNGEVYLRVTPPCSTIADASTVSDTVTVSMKDVDADPVVVTVEIRPNEEGACAVAIRAWPGPCVDGRGTPPGQIELAAPSQIMCVEASVPDSIPSIDITFPTSNDVDPLFIDSGGEPWTASGPSSMREVMLTRVNNLRGHLDFEITWRTPTLSDVVHLDLVHGAPGEGRIRIRGTPQHVDEYNTATFIFTTTYYAIPDSGSCVRAMPQDEDTTSLVVRSSAPRLAEQGTYVCGESIHTVEFVSGIDSAPAESIAIEMYRCSGCGDEPAADCCTTAGQLDLIDNQVVSIGMRSLAEAIADGTTSARACVDIDGDDRPEVVVADATSTHLYVAAGAEDVRFTSPFSFPSPASTFALQWRDGVNVRPVLVGEFSSPPYLRAATTTGWETTEWAELPVSPYGTDEWVPIGPRHGAGASYLVVQKSSSVFGFACISKPNCTSDGPLIDVSGLGGGGPQAGVVRGIGVADLDGDTDLDLLVAVDSILPIGSNRPLRLYAYDLRWQGHVLSSYQAPESFDTADPELDWTDLKFVALPNPGAADSVYVLASNATRNAIVETRPCGLACSVSRVLGTIGNAFQIAAVDGALFAATDIGIFELDGTTWEQRDPERASLPTSFPVPTDSITYGRTLRACLMGPGARSSILFDVESGARWTYADVVVETLPEP